MGERGRTSLSLAPAVESKDHVIDERYLNKGIDQDDGRKRSRRRSFSRRTATGRGKSTRRKIAVLEDSTEVLSSEDRFQREEGEGSVTNFTGVIYSV